MAENSIPMVPTSAILETECCRLRYPQMSDAKRAFSAFISPFFPKRLPLGQIRSLEETCHWIDQAQKRWAEGSAYTWSIERAQDDLMVGQVTLVQSPDQSRWSLAFWIHPENWGQGFATEAATKALEFAFTTLGAQVVWASTGMWNQASVSVLNKLGMIYVGDNPQGYIINDQPIPTQEFEISLGMWQKMKVGE
jgi:ribosomal-protein-alanine N-acetyltransferase